MKLKSLLFPVWFGMIGACADLGGNLEEAIKVAQEGLAPSQTESIAATRQALEKGVSHGIQTLQQENGFLQSSYRIPIPPEMQKVNHIARQIGLESYMQEFEINLNRAAEQAVGSAMPIFLDSIQQLSFEDIVAILTGPDNAATEFFRKTSEDKLEAAFMPIVARATEKNNVSQLYSKIMGSIRPVAMASGLAVAQVDLNLYVTKLAVDSLFTEIAVQEKKIRDNPKERSTKLLAKVFSYYDVSDQKL